MPGLSLAQCAELDYGQRLSACGLAAGEECSAKRYMSFLLNERLMIVNEQMQCVERNVH